MARFLLGDITEVSADVRTVIKQRPIARGGSDMKPVLVDDVARILVNFGRGCGGTIEANWMATGRKMQHDFEVYGTKGALAFSQEHFNVLNYFSTADARGRQGFRRIEASPDHAPYGLFCVAPGHQIGFNDLKTIEVAEFLSAIGKGSKASPDFREAWEIQKVVDAAIRSSKESSRGAFTGCCKR